MENLYVIKRLFVLLLSVIISSGLGAQNFKLIDINNAKGSYSSYPSNDQYVFNNMFAELNGTYYFSADDGLHGYELWSSDGTNENTKLVHDILPGTPASGPYNITASGNKVYFIAHDLLGLPQLWISDGTDAGTEMVTALIQSNASQNFFGYLTDVNNIVYFISNYYDSVGNQHNELWKSDGTKGGTEIVADLNTSDFNFGYNASHLVNINGKLFFRLDNSFSSQLYTTDGTAAGTKLVTGDYSYPSRLTNVNGALYFSAYDNSTFSEKLWVLHDVDTGADTVNNNGSYVPGDNGYNIPCAVVNNVLFFAAAINESGVELCKYNTVDANSGIELVKDINSFFDSYPQYLTDVDGTLFFIASTDNGIQQLFKSDGTTDGTVLVNDSFLGGYYGLINVKGTLMFAAYADTTGYELWKSDGTDTGTVMVKDINPGYYDSYPQYFTFKNDKFLFNANDGADGSELWTSDGTEAGTVMISDINKASTSSSYPGGFTSAGNGKTVFAATTNEYGQESWATDGTQEGTTLLKDIRSGPDYSYPRLFTKFKDKVFFAANSDSALSLVETDGTQAGTSVFLNLAYGTDIVYTRATDNLLYFFLFNYNTYQLELWRSDGTQDGTFAIKTDLNPNFDPIPTVSGETLFFVGYDDANGVELWKTDGTSNGTVIVKDINPGSNSSYPYQLHNFNGRLFFVADNGNGGGYLLWTSDGTDAGTQLVKPIYPVGFAQMNNKLFFVGFSTLARGYELYTTDGTRAGTTLVKDINRGPGSGFIYYFTMTDGDSVVYFTGYDKRHGNELWRTNGTTEGTYLVKNITPGNGDSYIYAMVNVNDKAFFVRNDTLWQSDGTKEGTHIVKDEVLKGLQNINGLTAIDNNIYFSAYGYETGQELYIGNIESAAPPAIIASNVLVPKINDAFAAKLLTNPVRDELKFVVNAKDRQPVQIIVADPSGRMVVSDKQILSPGANMFSYNIQSWSSGVYMIRIVAANGSSAQLKAVK